MNTFTNNIKPKLRKVIKNRNKIHLGIMKQDKLMCFIPVLCIT